MEARCVEVFLVVGLTVARFFVPGAFVDGWFFLVVDLPVANFFFPGAFL